MVNEVISNVGNRYIFALESAYGTLPSPFTALDLGHVQSISVNEDDTVEEISSMNSGHTLEDLDDDLYNLSGTILTKCTKASLPVILKALMTSGTVMPFFILSSILWLPLSTP